METKTDFVTTGTPELDELKRVALVEREQRRAQEAADESRRQARIDKLWNLAARQILAQVPLLAKYMTISRPDGFAHNEWTYHAEAFASIPEHSPIKLGFTLSPANGTDRATGTAATFTVEQKQIGHYDRELYGVACYAHHYDYDYGNSVSTDFEFYRELGTALVRAETEFKSRVELQARVDRENAERREHEERREQARAAAGVEEQTAAERLADLIVEIVNDANE